jgi:hypothetical protein
MGKQKIIFGAALFFDAGKSHVDGVDHGGIIIISRNFNNAERKLEVRAGTRVQDHCQGTTEHLVEQGSGLSKGV